MVGCDEATVVEEVKEAEDAGRDDDALPEVDGGGEDGDDDLERGRPKEDKADDVEEGSEARRKMWIWVCGVMCALEERCLDLAIGCTFWVVVVGDEGVVSGAVEVPSIERPLTAGVLDRVRVSGIGFRKKDPAAADQVAVDGIVM